MIKKINLVFVTFFGVGKIKYAPGTFASVLTTFILFYFFQIINLSNQIILFFILLIFFYSFFAVNDYIKEKENKDPKEIVIDEVVGQSIPIYLYEIAHGIEKSSGDAYLFYICMLILFRFFDIKKPFPVNYFDKKYKNTFGVMIDDVIAGLYVVLTVVMFMVFKSKFF